MDPVALTHEGIGKKTENHKDLQDIVHHLLLLDGEKPVAGMAGDAQHGQHQKHIGGVQAYPCQDLFWLLRQGAHPFFVSEIIQFIIYTRKMI